MTQQVTQQVNVGRWINEKLTPLGGWNRRLKSVQLKLMRVEHYPDSVEFLSVSSFVKAILLRQLGAVVFVLNKNGDLQPALFLIELGPVF